MEAKKPLVIDFAREENTQMLYPHKAVLSSYTANWDGLYLQYHHQPPQEISGHYSKQHRIIVHHYPLPTPKLEWVGELSQSSQVIPGTITIIPANTQNGAYWGTEHSFIVLIFESDLFAQHIGKSTDIDEVELLPTLSHPDPLIYSIGLALKAELESNGIGSRLYVDSLAIALTAHLLQHYSAQKRILSISESGLPKSKLREVIEYIHHHLGQDLTVAQLAAIAQVSPNYFSALFKQSTGLAPHQYVLRYRIARAKQLLREGELSIADISYHLGFSHQSHFSQHFKRLVGTSPKTFLKS
ncbi:MULTISPECIES: helix-turn-helix domain-containing protein [Nostoc]|jgi:AraC family transcriptional regulator|uniref:Helix-turn-helix transcriptional regulator n=1 Tax=Nostoc punctiforme FACHB-252 TaxID=1357509 RepID=A0ABR8H6R1_NOSPU|nr:MULTISPECIES: AraC family transcriptional regulator [Nostoc]MBC1236748.1 helix-turn-helix transcriptional regulator [Nostoc sp. 2RC]MBD2611507.1 helix-turn-helix transcriptional regulator [Nostoc punctiforme FACHB-252]